MQNPNYPPPPQQGYPPQQPQGYPPQQPQGYPPQQLQGYPPQQPQGYPPQQPQGYPPQPQLGNDPLSQMYNDPGTEPGGAGVWINETGEFVIDTLQTLYRPSQKDQGQWVWINEFRIVQSSRPDVHPPGAVRSQVINTKQGRAAIGNIKSYAYAYLGRKDVPLPECHGLANQPQHTTKRLFLRTITSKNKTNPGFFTKHLYSEWDGTEVKPAIPTNGAHPAPAQSYASPPTPPAPQQYQQPQAPPQQYQQPQAPPQQYQQPQAPPPAPAPPAPPQGYVPAPPPPPPPGAPGA